MVRSVQRKITRTFGFTLIELLMVIVLLGIILAIAAPTFNQMVAGSRITAELDDLSGSLGYARSEAIKQGLNVIVCPSTNVSSATPTCADQTAWATGWIVIATTGDCTSTTGMFLRKKDGFSSTDLATYKPRTTGNNYVCYSRFGLASTSYTGLFVFTESDGSSNKRCLSLSSTGVGQTLRVGETDASGVLCQ